MTTVEALKAARAKIEQGWCQGEFAIAATGQPLDFGTHPAACKWCVLGAFQSTFTTDSQPCYEALQIFRDANALEESITVFNDTPGRTQAEVLAAFSKAIELAEKQ